MRSALIFTLLLLSTSPCLGETEEELIATVDLKFLRGTDEPAAFVCFDEEESNCVVWATHYLWRATVRKVISGTETEKHFLVLYGHHALLTKNLRGITAVLKRLKPDAPFGARYQIVARGSPMKLLCFSHPISLEGVQTLSEPGTDPLSCLRPDDE
jgi:hypothetical protein